MRKAERKIILNLDASYKVKHEKYEKFQDSYFGEVYQQAGRMVREIIDTGKADFDYKSQEDYTEPISNIITFNGKRGSGKTSAMLSFCDFLRDFRKYSKEGKVCRELLEKQSNISFTVLGSIDATLVSEPKDLIGAILGKMLAVLNEKERKESERGKNRDLKVGQLKGELGEIYSSLLPTDLKQEDVTAGGVLKELRCSWNQQEAFRKAVKNFNQYMIKEEHETWQNYLVIPLDDVDLNLKNGYQLLETIRKYLMAPNVIVLLAVDYQQVGRLCFKEYKKELSNEDDIEELEAEFLEKLLPTGRIISMPDLYMSENLHEKKIMLQEKGKELPIKSFILKNAWHYIGMILDEDQQIKHWYEPDSLRKLSNYINSMKFLSEYRTDDTYRIWEQNISWYYKDIMGRYLLKGNEKCRDIKRIIEEFLKEIPEKKLISLYESLKGKEYIRLQNDSEDTSLITYGKIVQMLYQSKKSKNGDSSEIQIVSFILTLYMRVLVECMDDTDYRKELVDFSKNEFWTDYNICYLEDMKIAKVSDNTMKGILEQECEELSGIDYIYLGMQLGIQEDEQGKYKTSFKFGNFINEIFDYEAKINDICNWLECNTNDTIKSNLEECKQTVIDEFECWKSKYGTICLIPFDNVEFMFKMFEIFYGEQGLFHGKEMENDYNRLYVMALQKMRDILNEYDEKYKSIREQYKKEDSDKLPIYLKHKYADIFMECPFVKYMLSEGKTGIVIDEYITLVKKANNTDSSTVLSGNEGISGEINTSEKKEGDLIEDSIDSILQGENPEINNDVGEISNGPEKSESICEKDSTPQEESEAGRD